MTTPTALPYGLRDVKLTRYTDEPGSVLAAASVDLPNAQTFSFTEQEEFTELRGDDRVVATRGQGSQLEWELESGGISLPAWEILTGGTVIEKGIAPNRTWTLRKRSTQSRPYFRVNGRILSDSGGDVHGVIYRAKVTDTVEGEFSDGEFFITSASGNGLPMLVDDYDLLYDIVINEASTPLTLTPTPNPPAPPTNLAAGAVSGITPNAQSTLTWTASAGATSYNIQRRLGAAAWGAGTPATSASATSIQTALSTGTWEFRVTALIGTTESVPSATVLVTVP